MRFAQHIEQLESRRLMAVSLSGATSIGTLIGRSTFNDSLSSSNLNDTRKFTLSAAATFKATLSGLAADANLQLINDANHNNGVDLGEINGTSAKTGTINEIISKPLAAGTYYLRVYRGSGDTNYSLAITPVGHLNIVFDYS